MRRFLVAGNWKMNGDAAANRSLVDGIIANLPAATTVQVLVCPPFTVLSAVADRVGDSALLLGSQNVSEFESGAYTGETAAAMLVEAGCQFAIVGHSERRAIFGETSEQVAQKFKAALGARLTPILCVGETLEEREAGDTWNVIDGQLQVALDTNGVDSFSRAVIAYEPVWAIGTGMTASPDQAQEVHSHIRNVLHEQNEGVAAGVQILYGGSVKGDNAAGLFNMPDIDGGLIGGASLKAQDFLAIVDAAAETTAANEV